MHDLVQLPRDQSVDLRDARVQHRFRVGFDGDRAFQHFLDEALDQVTPALARRRFRAEAPLVDDLIQQAYFRSARGGLRSLCFTLGHRTPPVLRFRS
jgi:hypothetical protein